MNIRPGRRNDDRIGSDALQKSNWPSALFCEDCAQPRWPAGGCPSDLKCMNAFGSAESQTAAILALRSKMFKPGTKRSASLLKELVSMRQTGTIKFVMSEIPVCKYYYRLASGVRRQLFDLCVRKALDATSDGPKKTMALSSISKSKRQEGETLSALDLIFPDKSIKEDPTRAMTKVHIRTRWKTIYNNDYKRIVPEDRQVPYDTFVAIRKRQRPQYMKSPRMRKGK